MLIKFPINHIKEFRKGQKAFLKTKIYEKAIQYLGEMTENMDKEIEFTNNLIKV